MSQYSVVLCVTDGVEDIEAVTSIDILTRSKINVITISTNNQHKIKCAYGTNLYIDILLKNYQVQNNHIAIILPGGLQAAEHFATNHMLLSYIKLFKKTQRIIGAICATPAIFLATHNIFTTAKMTSYVGLKNLVPDIQWLDKPVVWDEQNKLLTAQSVKHAINFNLKLVSIILNNNIASNIQSVL
ncbi:DJ-1 family protein [Enterobacteriaceae endosymbiont of Macroplea mutica]|uniref:DJ-1/PfpI family protein n=1 Tax=Enterobacteriaceae endosymbiont of Macroplea mutica TaxID=2675791 RepID=UPI001448C9E0|nr:DJ-1/PfpI family protein [Enterobacteriaceae endosymbiont of Macroplea mutica]QJC31087.1 DJ-1 family protein [Enterobacteriaceae endosymbiont of Macroplea mutica]